jgi:hypothetical protein
MKRFMTACVLLAITGCGSGQDGAGMIGKTVIVSPSGQAKTNFPNEILAVSPSPDPEQQFDVLPKFLPPFRAVVIDDIAEVSTSEGKISARWAVRPEEGDYAGIVIGVYKKHAKLTPTR